MTHIVNKSLEGDTRKFACINTTEYNGDGKWLIQVASYAELPELGIDEDEMQRLDALSVGDTSKDFGDYGFMVVRIA